MLYIIIVNTTEQQKKVTYLPRKIKKRKYLYVMGKLNMIKKKKNIICA